ncbi:MAG: hypothetical protein ACJ8R9_05460 [Steroidobacteraceae bacterium]
MSILLNEDILAVWFVDVSETSNWCAALSKHPLGTRLMGRMRYYERNSPPDSEDQKDWFEEILRDSPEEAIEKVRARFRSASAFAQSKPYELIRGNRTLDDFVEEFLQAPFIHVSYYSTGESGASLPILSTASL